MTSAAIIELIRLGRFAMETVDDYQSGKISEAEMERRWRQMQDELNGANELWEQAGE